MGNCSIKSVAAAAAAAAKGPNSIRIMTDSGGILQFEGPILVGEVLADFPGHGVFGKGNLTSPLLDHELLLHGRNLYYLLPLGEGKLVKHNEEEEEEKDKEPAANEGEAVRMSTSAAVEVLPPPRKGVWRVKLVIDIKQLEEILSEEVNTEALIEQMRLAASSASFTPKRAKTSWGQWGNVIWKPILVNLFKGPIDCHI